jgi:hypothetical protein
MDVESAREHISYQHGLCSEIRFLDHDLGVLRAQTVGAAGLQAGGLDNAVFASLFDSASALELRQVMGELADVQKWVWRLNRVYAGLIRRSRRSINVQQSKLYPELVALVSIADLLCRANELGYGYPEKRLPDPLQAIEWEILREKSPKLVRLGPAHVVQELSGHAKRIQKHVKSVFQG